jgi:hypothetical protein
VGLEFEKVALLVAGATVGAVDRREADEVVDLRQQTLDGLPPRLG